MGPGELFQLIAAGSDPRQRWRAAISTGVDYSLGRDVEADLPVPWDQQISRRHVRLRVAGDRVDVETLSDALNPVFFQGEASAAFRLTSGEHFVIGSTSFQVVATNAEPQSPTGRPLEEITFDRQTLMKVRYRDADKRIDVLSHLPEVILGARSDAELHARLVNLILAGVVNAEAAAIVRFADGTEKSEDGEAQAEDSLKVEHWERRRETAGAFRPSSRLAVEAVLRRKQSVLHIWEPFEAGEEDYTAVAEFDWAFCTPVPSEPRGAWGLYVAGRIDGPSGDGRPAAGGVDLQADVKFTELVAEIISSVRRVNTLERRISGFRQFFAPSVLDAIGEDPATELLEPRECDVTVLFCDLRGFSQQAEESADNLIGLLERVSRALEVMTHHIRAHVGVTADFQGDAALGFFGWPFASDEAPLNACRAALGIRREFAEARGRPDHPLADFEMGIGIAHGRAVAGKIGTREQVKITVFGPVVNLASRLETMTKQLRVPIVLDESTADLVRSRMSADEARIRRLARVLPYGMETPVVVSELLPPASEYPELTDEHVAQYERGVEHFIKGEWAEAWSCLHETPANDRAQDFLSIRIAQHNRAAPSGWDGVIRLSAK